MNFSLGRAVQCETALTVNKREAMIDASDISFRYRHRPVLADVSFSVFGGEHVALIGPSGAGKSTLLQLIVGLLRPERGSINVNGAPVTGRAHGAVMMFQRPALLPWASAEENVLLPLRFSGAHRKDANRARIKVRALLDQIGLGDHRASLPSQLSGGQQQRVALARALAGDPGILLLDEPFSALDPETRAGLRNDVRKLARDRNITLVIVTHDLADAAALADRALILGGAPARIIEDLQLDHNGEHELRARLALLRNAA